MSDTNKVEVSLNMYKNVQSKRLADQYIGNYIASGSSKGVIKSTQANEDKIKNIISTKTVDSFWSLPLFPSIMVVYVSEFMRFSFVIGNMDLPELSC